MMGPGDFTAYASRQALAQAVAQRVAEEVREALATRGQARLAVPGGTTPEDMLRQLGRQPLAWSKVTLTTTDERCVPPQDPRSNQRLVRHSLMEGPASAARFVPLYDPADEGDLVGVTARLKARVLPLDVAVLGMGSDGHTASIFPTAPELEAALAPIAPPLMGINPADTPEPRRTLTAPVFQLTPRRHLLITGAEKRAALEAALSHGNPRLAPVLAVLEGARVHYAP